LAPEILVHCNQSYTHLLLFHRHQRYRHQPCHIYI
jgi:hypothetical protein